MDPAAGGRRFENRRSVWLCIKESTRGLIHRITLCAAIPNGTVRGDRYNLSGSKKVCRGVPPPSTIAFFYIYTYQYNIKAPAQIHCVYTLTYLDSITFSSFFFFLISFHLLFMQRSIDERETLRRRWFPLILYDFVVVVVDVVVAVGWRIDVNSSARRRI